jgi:hypothetical protein
VVIGKVYGRAHGQRGTKRVCFEEPNLASTVVAMHVEDIPARRGSGDVLKRSDKDIASGLDHLEDSAFGTSSEQMALFPGNTPVWSDARAALRMTLVGPLA